MNKKHTILGIIAIVFSLLLGWLIFGGIISWLKLQDSSVVAAFTTALFGLSGLWYAQWHSKTRDIAENHRASKIKVYSIFFDLVEKFQAEEITNEEIEKENFPDWLKKDFTELNRGLILWASPNVITAWLEFRTISTSGGNIVLAMDEMYKAIRKDLGNSNFGLKAGDLIRIGLKDPDELK
jgi:uncharacterized membrane protein YfbV (UPF0208 family)